VPITPTKKIWMNGTLVDWDDATIHILNPTLHYGWGVFEGIRAYGTSQGTAVFRLTDHIARLFRSAKVYFLEPDFTEAEIVAATKEVVRIAEVESCYVRPIMYLGYGEMGLNPLPSHTEVAIACWPWGLYLGPEAMANGCRAMTSSWQHINQNSIAPQGKGTGQYVNSSLSKVAALKAGYDEAVLLSPAGNVVQGNWTAAGGQLCLQTGTGRECWPYSNAFQAGQQVGFGDVQRQHHLGGRGTAEAVELLEQRQHQRELAVADDRNGDRGLEGGGRWHGLISLGNSRFPHPLSP